MAVGGLRDSVYVSVCEQSRFRKFALNYTVKKKNLQFNF